jgi:hypothetical protein
VEGQIMGDAPDNTQVWQFTRAKIEHEQKWIQQRVSWNLASTSFLLGAYVALLNGVDSTGPVSWLTPLLLIGIPILGVVFSTFVLAGLSAAWVSQRSAVKDWRRLVPDAETRERFPEVHSKRLAIVLGRGASWGTTLAALLAWLFLLLQSVV